MIKKTLQYKITEKDQGKTVEQFLRSKGYSHRLVVKLRNSPTGLTIGGELAFTIHRLQAGEILIATLEEENSQNIVPVELPLNIVYEDEDILVVNKHAGKCSCLVLPEQRPDLSLPGDQPLRPGYHRPFSDR